MRNKPIVALLPVQQFIRFCYVGVSNTIIGYAVYSLCIALGMHYIIANLIGFLISVFNAFIWSHKYVFKAEDGEQRALFWIFVKTLLAYGSTGIVLSSLLLYLFIDCYMLSCYLAQFYCLIITIPTNFVLNKLWTFNQ